MAVHGFLDELRRRRRGRAGGECPPVRRGAGAVCDPAAGRVVLGGPVHPRAPARGDRRSTTRPSPGTGSVRPRARVASRPPRRRSPSRIDDPDAPEPPEADVDDDEDRPEHDPAVQPHRGAPGPRLRRPRRRRAGRGQPPDGRPAPGRLPPALAAAVGRRDEPGPPRPAAHGRGRRCAPGASPSGVTRPSRPPGPGGSCCWPTSAARWSRTAGPWCASPTWPWRPGPGSRRSPSAPA